MKILIQVLLGWWALVLFIGCGSGEKTLHSTTVSLWHFWSEPTQKQALTERIHAFELANPDVSVQMVELQWSDGKAKLQLAFSAGTPPDVLHLGFEWLQEYARAGVLAPLDDSMLHFPPTDAALRSNEKLYGSAWTINTRAFLVQNPLASADSLQSWEDFSARIRSSHSANSFGVNSAEPHNVLKKALPIIWSSGSRLFQFTPLSHSFDSTAVIGLQRYVEMSKGGMIEQSRRLDEKFLAGNIGAWMTGQWIIGSARALHADTNFTVLGRVPGSSGASILGGDALAVSARSPNRLAAERLVRFLTSYEQSRALCLAIPDAGFPANPRSFDDTAFTADHLKRGFLQQVRTSIALPPTPIFLDAEAALEDEIMQAVYGVHTPAEALYSARERIKNLENKR